MVSYGRQSLDIHHNPFEEMTVALPRRAEGLPTLQQQLDSLAVIVRQNQIAFNLLTAGPRHTRLYLKDECSLYITQSGLVQENIRNVITQANESNTVGTSMGTGSISYCLLCSL